MQKTARKNSDFILYNSYQNAGKTKKIWNAAVSKKAESAIFHSVLALFPFPFHSMHAKPLRFQSYRFYARWLSLLEREGHLLKDIIWMFGRH